MGKGAKSLGEKIMLVSSLIMLMAGNSVTLLWSFTLTNFSGRSWPSVCRKLEEHVKRWTPSAPPLRRPSRGSRMRLRTSCSTWRGPMLPARPSIRSRGTWTRWLSLYKLHHVLLILSLLSPSADNLLFFRSYQNGNRSMRKLRLSLRPPRRSPALSALSCSKSKMPMRSPWTNSKP